MTSVSVSCVNENEIVNTLQDMKKCHLIKKDMDFFHFIDECFARGYNDYLKDLNYGEEYCD